MNEVWLRLRNGTWNRFWSDGESYYPFEDDDDAGIKYYVTDDYGNLTPVFDPHFTVLSSNPAPCTELLKTPKPYCTHYN